MIYFAADNHYKADSGQTIYNQIKDSYDIHFEVDEFDKLANLTSDTSLLVLHLISGTCDNGLPGEDVENAVKKYLENGGKILLLHGSSAAFWHWEWWTKLVGHRWVRPNDPYGSEKSTHPIDEYDVTLCKTTHPLAKKLKPMKLQKDEIYIDLEQTCPTTDLMETHYDGKRYVQCWSHPTPWGGEIVGLLPGHAPAVTEDPAFIDNLKALIDYLS